MNNFSRAIQVIIIAGLIGIAHTSSAQSSRSQIKVVGSSTVYPFATVVAESFGNTSSFKTPTIEATGSGGGLKAFCEGIGVQYPDITNSSRRIKQSEIELCASHNVNEIIEVKIGNDGIVLANSIEAQPIQLTLRVIFLALAKQVPDPDGSLEQVTHKKLVANPYRTWQDIDSALPAQKIEVLGPPPTSGTRDAFVELAMEGGCNSFDWIKKMKSTDKAAYKALCHTIREDGAFIEAGENDNLIVKKLGANPDAVGIFGFSFLDQNKDRVQGASINKVEPVFESISDGSYPISRPLYVYVKKAHVGKIPGIEEFLNEFISENAIGEYGYLADKGLIPLPEEEQALVVATVKNLMPLKLASN